MTDLLKHTTLLLNCDMGESLGPWLMGRDDEVMPLIDMASIACGFHASDPLTMDRTVRLAKETGTRIGAHPAYPDLVGFGRRSMQCTAEEIRAKVLYQLGALSGICRAHGMNVSYIKPHGALYNDMHQNMEVLRAVMQAVSDFADDIPLMVLAQTDNRAVERIADEFNVPLIYEAFADRGYNDDGRLIPRDQPGAVFEDRDTILSQVRQLAESGSVTTDTGRILKLLPDTICVHGDNTESVNAIVAIRELLNQLQAAG